MAASLDGLYFSTAAGGLLYGLTPVSGGVIPSVMGDLASSVSATGSGQVVFVASPGLAAEFPLRAPDLRVVIYPSLAVPAGRIVAIDPLSLIHGFGPEPDIESGEEAVLHMSDAPLPIVSGAPTTADPVMSAFQVAMVVTRLIVDVAFASRRTGAVAYVDSAQW